MAIDFEARNIKLRMKPNAEALTMTAIQDFYETALHQVREACTLFFPLFKIKYKWFYEHFTAKTVTRSQMEIRIYLNTCLPGGTLDGSFFQFQKTPRREKKGRSKFKCRNCSKSLDIVYVVF
mmetsp:Transcript_57695/g.78669  ORF Transcript_57695/g.78669 Transcript_57695/m.78669 type:complete len:122 (-) Transcript_57695:705-1070(-)